MQIRGFVNHSVQTAHAVLFESLLLVPARVHAQATTSDYARADSLNARYRTLTSGIAETPHWLDSRRFWYRVSVLGGNQFVLVDAVSHTKQPAFDHARIAASLSTA